jgi:hypothetical protein
MARPFGCRELGVAEQDLNAHGLPEQQPVRKLIAVSATSRLLCKLPPKLPGFLSQGTWG